MTGLGVGERIPEYLGVNMLTGGQGGMKIITVEYVVGKVCTPRNR